MSLDLQARAASIPEEVAQFYKLASQAPDLLTDPRSTCGRVMKRLVEEGPAPSRVLGVGGFDVIEQPFSMPNAAVFRAFNPHHSSCLDMMPRLTFGAGWSSGFKIEDALDPLCGAGHFFEELISALDNRYEFGQGYLEIIRDPNDNLNDKAPIVGIHWLPAERMYRIEVPLDERGNQPLHLRGYALSPETAWASTMTKSSVARTAPSAIGPVHAPFGWAKEFAEHYRLDQEQTRQMTEIIDLRVHRTRSTGYGIPRWLSVVAGLEMIQAGVQHEFDFFYNRGMPHWLLFLLGAKISDKDWTKMMLELQSHVGTGNSYKGAAFNFDKPDLKTELHQLGSNETTKSRYVENSGEMALQVVSAHGVPPRLAGVVLPGKIGAVNEAITDVWLFQNTLLFSHQRAVSRVLASTLGNPECNGSLGLTREDFLGSPDRRGNGFVTIMEDPNLLMVSGSARMKDPAVASDRDPADGPLQNGQQRFSRNGSANGVA